MGIFFFTSPRQIVLHFLCAVSDQSKVSSGIVLKRDAEKQKSSIGSIFVLNVCLHPPNVWVSWWTFHCGSQRWSLVHLLTKMAFENCVSEDFDPQQSLTPS